jgi:hypothetical protein
MAGKLSANTGYGFALERRLLTQLWHQEAVLRLGSLFCIFPLVYTALLHRAIYVIAASLCNVLSGDMAVYRPVVIIAWDTTCE